MEHLHQITIDVYNAVLQVLFGEPDDCAQAMREYNIEEEVVKDWLRAVNERPNCHGMFSHHDDKNFTMLWLRDIPTTVKTYASLVHEIEHYVFYLLNRIGMRHTEASDEAFAYLQAYVFEQIDNIIVTSRKENEKQE